MRKISRFAVAALICGGLISAFAREPVRTRHAMVVSQEPLATDVGVEVLKSGGNAVDAAIAVAFALAVTHPSAGNLGGGGFLLLRFADGRTTFFDFRERAPLSAGHDMYLDSNGKPTDGSRIGWRASGVPGTVKGLEAAHRKYGRKPWPELVAPAVRLARDGVELTFWEARSIQQSDRQMERFPESKRIFLNEGQPFEAGDRLTQPELAETLARIAKYGAKDFYEGETAERLVAQMARNGGNITVEDLKAYEVVERRPLTGSYRGYDIVSAPPPSSGGIGLLQMMGMLEGSGYEKPGAGSAASTHYLAEVMRRYYADRAAFLGDPDFVKIPVSGLVNPKYAKKLAANIDRAKATPSDEIRAGDPAPYESTETTHLNVIDADGNIAALTYTLNGSYGSGVTVPGLGFLMNNEMDDFTTKPGEPNMFGLVQGEANSIVPRKRPLSSMTPTIVLRDGKPYIVAGAPGGSRIITGVLQVILNVLDFGMTIQESVDQPRLHHQWKPDKLYLEKGFSPDTKAILENMGHRLDEAATVASVEAILIDGRWLQGAQNGRSSGKAAGY